MTNLEQFIGKYVNRRGYSDTTPVGKIIGILGKSTLIIKEVVAGPNKVKMEYVAGGFSAHCINQSEQEYDFTETDKVLKMRYSKQWLHQYSINECPLKYYDYNF